MKVLLLAPSQSNIYGKFLAPSYPPLGLGYIAAVLIKAGHNVAIIDMDADRILEGHFIRRLETENFDLVGITATTPTFNNAIYLAKLTKGNSGAATVLGGIHITIMPEESIKYDSVDFAVQGEGEHTIVELADYLAGGRDLESVDGIYYKKNGRVFRNKERELIADLDEIPFPARHLFKQQNYTYPDTLYRRAWPIITSRGCPSDCSYCNSKNIFKRKFRARNPEAIIDEIAHLKRNYNVKEIHIWDDNFTVIKERVFKIRDGIKRRGLKLKFAFPNGLRVDCVDAEILKALKDMGTYNIAFGVESGDQAVLDSINKKIRLEQIERSFRMAKKAGLETWGFFMIGLPGETASSIKNTIDFAIKLGPQVAKFHILKPFPGTKAHEDLTRGKLILDTDFDKYGIHTPPVHRLESLGREEILAWQKRAYKEFYFRPVFLLKQLLRIRTLNRLSQNFKAGLSILKLIRLRQEASGPKGEPVCGQAVSGGRLKRYYCRVCGQNYARTIAVMRANEFMPIVKCRKCNLVFIVRHSSGHLAADYFHNYDLQKYISYYKEFRLNAFRKHLGIIEKFIPKGRILDAGCSFGWFLKLARDSGWQALGIEPSDKAGEFARKEYGLDVISGSIEAVVSNLNMDFQVITLWNVLEHLPSPLEALGLLRNKLAGGGIMVVAVPNIEGLFSRLSFWSYKLGLGRLDFFLRQLYQADNNFMHLFHFSEATLTHLLKKSNFKILKVIRQPVINISNLEARIAIGPGLKLKSQFLKFNLIALAKLLFYVSRITNMQDEIVIYAKKA